MTDSGVRLLALTILFPVLVIVALALALVGCDAQPAVWRTPGPRRTGGRCPLGVVGASINRVTFETVARLEKTDAAGA
jgi:hypothetical protein